LEDQCLNWLQTLHTSSGMVNPVSSLLHAEYKEKWIFDTFLVKCN
jgi:hypothetical protein